MSADWSWKAIGELTDRAIDWSVLATFEHIDPYMAWADATQFASSTLDPKPKTLPLLIRLALPKCEVSALAVAPSPLVMTGASRIHAASRDAVYITGSVGIESVLRLVPGECINVGSEEDPDWRQVDFAAMMAVPRVAAADPSIQSLSVATDVNWSSRPVVALIDDGCPFANRAYRQLIGGKPCTRVVHLWDQNSTEPIEAPWRPVAGFGYGRQISNIELDEVLQDHRTDDENVDEDACYAAVGLPALVGSRFSHGAHMLGLATGSPDPAVGLECGSLALDAAGSADIVFVQLPREVMRDTSGGGLARHVLDGLRYIDLMAVELTLDGKLAKRPVVVNVSVGASGGPHDGTSLAELAIDDFVKHRPACAVVVAAGNARGHALHADATLVAQATTVFYWHVAPDDGTDSFLELWVARTDQAGDAARVEVKLVPPGSTSVGSDWVGVGATKFAMADGKSLDGMAIAAVIHSKTTGNSRSGNLILCALSPTAQKDDTGLAIDRPLAPAGVWEVHVRNAGESTVVVSAWIERDDPSYGGSGHQSRFDEHEGPTPENEKTLSSLAYGEATVVVGGYQQKPEELVDLHSGEGPGRIGLGRMGPDLVAPSGESDALPGMLSYGVHSAEFNRLEGTSCAAAIASRRIINRWYARGVPQSDWRAVKADLINIIDVQRNPQGEPETRLGLGRLRVPSC